MLPGGAERVAINILNNLETYKFTPFLVTSRSDGPLLASLANNIKRMCLQRRFRFDIHGVLRFIKFVKDNNIHIIHAHEYTIFIALISKLLVPGIVVIWHNHMSSMLKLKRARPWFLLAGRTADMVVVANNELANWTREKIKISTDKVRYIPNFVDSRSLPTDFPEHKDFLDVDKDHKRIVCVGNIKPEKDQIALIRAFGLVIESIRGAHLILVGKVTDRHYAARMHETIRDLGIMKHVSILGLRNDVPAVLAKCDIGILSSKNEAFPMALIEYGCAKLPSIATSVGQCPEILDYGRAGVLVEPDSPEQLATAIVQLLKSPQQMNSFGQILYDRVRNRYSPEKVMLQYKDLYTQLLINRSSND
jgi:glycosyltransferase involved in cell wall biosynthesis